MSNENFKDGDEAQKSGQQGYKDKVNDKDLESRTPAPSLPMAPAPSPFSFGNGGQK